MIDRYDGFTLSIHRDDDGDYLAHFIELPEISACGDTPESALCELDTAWRLYKESCIADKVAIPVAPTQRTYNGQFQVRIDRRLHRALAIEAAQAGISLNALVGQKLLSATRSIG